MVEKSLGMRSPEASETDVAASSPSSSSKSSLALCDGEDISLCLSFFGALFLDLEDEPAPPPPPPPPPEDPRLLGLDTLATSAAAFLSASALNS